MTNKLTNPVGYLQEFCQRYRTAKFPNYIELPAVGPDHSREFSCKCLFDGFEVSGKGIQKKQAKSDAAKNMLLLLEEKHYFDKFGISETDSCSSTGVQPAAQHITSSSKNPISALQEYCQQNKLMLPKYVVNSLLDGFICECSFDGSKTFGEGSNKKTAKTESASKMCRNLGILFCGDGLEKNIKDERFVKPSVDGAVCSASDSSERKLREDQASGSHNPRFVKPSVDDLQSFKALESLSLEDCSS
ncbi:RISC-loading complex subunit tarbp2-like isoform X2 [Homalodisca vitripennis]|uniref:RISC-loading complex subunit tarbp2-like isoform X2 n=1 Tax=Homalodisca vitripennis TaxID=197043 RepID=UPI001EEC5172|nr:RISC-loading complex subunit tarbp2-like isoform X2 [Homalodisca vitripennis]